MLNPKFCSVCQNVTPVKTNSRVKICVYCLGYAGYTLNDFKNDPNLSGLNLINERSKFLRREKDRENPFKKKTEPIRHLHHFDYTRGGEALCGNSQFYEDYQHQDYKKHAFAEPGKPVTCRHCIEQANRLTRAAMNWYEKGLTHNLPEMVRLNKTIFGGEDDY